MRKSQNKRLRATVRGILTEELKSLLNDATYRLGVLYDAERGGGRVGSRDLNLAMHQLDGFVVTDNSPTAGKVAWTDCNIAYKGNNYVITSGNTALKYIWWDFSVSTTAFQTTDTKPTLEDDDVMVFINNSGAHQTVIGTGRMVDGAVIKNSSVSGTEIGANAIAETHVANDAITNLKIKNGEVIAGKLGTNAVATGNIADNAVAAAKINAGAVTAAKMNTTQHLIF